jgi:nitrite reductase (NADH) small subunit
MSDADAGETEFVTVARVGEIAEGTASVYTLGDRLVAVFNVGGGEYQAIDDLCPHMGASLAGGWIEQGVVTCPWHAWRFRLCDGTWCDNPRIKTDSFDVRVVGDEIQVSKVPRKRTASNKP